MSGFPMGSHTPSLPQALEIIEEFRSLLWKRYGARFKGIVLYGSYARGEPEEGSDIDLLLLMDSGTPVGHEQQAISQLTRELNDKHCAYGVLLAPILLGERDYQGGKSPFFLNVKREGIFFAPGDRVDMQPEIDDLLRRASQELEAVQLLLEGGFYSVAASRAYYAMFYAAEGVLLSKGIARSRHSGVIAAFNEYFVRTGLLPDTLAAALSEVFDQRNKADYDPRPFPKEWVESTLADAQSFVCAVERFLATQSQ